MKFKFFSIVIFVVALAVKESVGDKAIVLNDASFKDVVKTNNFFIMFFAPW